MTQQIAKNI